MGLTARAPWAGRRETAEYTTREAVATDATVDAIVKSLYEIVSRPAVKKLLSEEETAKRLAWQRSRSPPEPAEPLWYGRRPPSSYPHH